MTHTRKALLSAATRCLLLLATPAIAELQHPPGCLSCAAIEVPGPTERYDHEAASVTAPLRPERHHRRPRRGVAGTHSR
jgi:hypothetical protein